MIVLLTLCINPRYLNSQDLTLLCRGLATGLLGNLQRSLHGNFVTLSLLATERCWDWGGGLTHVLNNILVLAGSTFPTFTLRTAWHLSTGTLSSTLEHLGGAGEQVLTGDVLDFCWQFRLTGISRQIELCLPTSLLTLSQTFVGSF